MVGKLEDRYGRPIPAQPDWVFGEPTLLAVRNSDAVWSRGALSPYFQKSATGWLANLYGGVQTNDDFAAINIPANDLKVPDFTEALWTYYMTSTQTFGINIVIWVHDPDDNSKRAEITQRGNVSGLAKAAGWNSHILDIETTQFLYYGENVSGSGLTSGTLYTWTQFKEDVLFSNWRIYRVSLEYGWESSGTFDDAWVADIKLNGEVIPLKPDSGGTGRIGHRFYFSTDTSAASTLAPKTPFRLLSIDCEIASAGTSDESLTITKDAGRGATYDTLLLTQNTKTPAITSLFVPFGENYNFAADDEIDMLWANSQARDFGFTWTYQTVF